MLNNHAFMDPCAPEKSPEDFLGDIIEQLCIHSDGIITPTDIEEALEGVDHIIINNNLTSLCPLVDCLFNKLVDGGLGSDFVCNLTSQFDGSTGSNNGVGFHMHIVPKDFSLDPNADPNSLAFTTISNGRPVIAINSNNCNQNSDLFDIFDTFQHEMIHANILQNLLNNGWSGTNTDYA